MGEKTQLTSKQIHNDRSMHHKTYQEESVDVDQYYSQQQRHKNLSAGGVDCIQNRLHDGTFGNEIQQEKGQHHMKSDAYYCDRHVQEIVEHDWVHASVTERIESANVTFHVSPIVYGHANNQVKKQGERRLCNEHDVH